MNKNKGFAPLVLIVSVAVVVLVAAGGTYFWYKNQNLQSPQSSSQQTATTTQATATSSIPASQYKPYKVEVDWEKEPILLKEKERCSINLTSEEDCEFVTNYFVGKITNGEFKGYSLFLTEFSFISTQYDHYVKINSEIFPLEENKFGIKGITDLSSEIFLPLDYILKKGYIQGIFDRAEIKGKLFSLAGLGDFYETKSGTIIFELPNHTAMVYVLQLPFFNRENGELDLTFNDGVKNQELYSNCGILGAYCNTESVDVSRIVGIDQKLTVIGKTNTGENFYGFTDPNESVLKALYNTKDLISYNYSTGKNKYTYEQFIRFHPMLFWRDPFGRWTEFLNRKFMTIGEKAKPAIYLYPKQKTILNVQVSPDGGFTETIPNYPSGGWNVEASPDGQIVYLETGQKYDYLYWSGLGAAYLMQDNEGWVVKKENLAEFFDSKLALLGLNQKEIKDFKDYWLNRLNDNPYYQICFMSREEIDRTAPLKISPATPDTIIRMLMAAKGLSEPKSSIGQKLPETPVRNGFTAVEWGGMLVE